jgi:hypothetical protein
MMMLRLRQRIGISGEWMDGMTTLAIVFEMRDERVDGSMT